MVVQGKALQSLSWVVPCDDGVEPIERTWKMGGHSGVARSCELLRIDPPWQLLGDGNQPETGLLFPKSKRFKERSVETSHEKGTRHKLLGGKTLPGEIRMLPRSAAVVLCFLFSRPTLPRKAQSFLARKSTSLEVTL